MSSTTQPKRDGLDAYYTPDAVARACVATLNLRTYHTVWEPHAGGGAFVRAILPPSVYRIASDINPDAPGLREAHESSVCDFLTAERHLRDPDWIIGNPPFNDAEAHVRQALKLTSYGVGLLLRLAFLASAKRAALFREFPVSKVYVLTHRPSFTGGGTDSADYGWFIWNQAHVGPTTLHHLDWRA